MDIEILMVEDDLMQQKILSNYIKMIKDVKSNVTVVASGEAAVKQATGKNFDLIIMDHGLAGEMNGYVAAKEIRKIKDTPIVWCSVHSDPQKVGAGDFDWYAKLSKPYSFEQLSNIVKSIK